MTETVGSFEAKTHLAALLDRVSKGATIVITRHGKPVARLVPPEDEAPKLTVAEAIEEMRKFRAAHPLKGLKIKDLIEEGRRF